MPRHPGRSWKDADRFDALTRTLTNGTTSRRRALQLLGGGALAGMAGRPQRGAGAAAQGSGGSTTLFADDFAAGFSAEGTDANWFHFGIFADDGTPVYLGDDGTAMTTAAGLQVAAAG